MKSTDVINSIEELKKLDEKKLDEAAYDIRQFLINSLSKTGGHLGSNLGIVELTMSLHRNFDSPTDKLIFDVGHQCYVHKILTGRADKFDSLRMYNGLSGFIKRKESEHDIWEAGHASTSISAAAGFALSRDLNNENNHVVAIIGDGSMTNGMTMEALNHISELDTKVIIIINDNEMSISKNIGFIDNLLKDLQKSEKYYKFKLDIHKFLNKKYVPFGKSIDKFFTYIKHLLKIQISKPHAYFNIMGLKYFGPIDGHNFKDLDEHIKLAKECKESVLLHVKTVKGKGYEYAETNSWHGVNKFDVKTGESLTKTSNSMTFSKVVSNTVSNFMQTDESIITITPAMIDGSELEDMNKKFPKRVTDVGIAEEHALTFAAALALNNKKPFVAIYSTFLQRAYDQLFHDVVRHNCHVVIGVDRAGLVGADGETHQGIYDISFTSHMPYLTITQGKDQYETQQLLKYGFYKQTGPFIVRYNRGGNFTEIKDNDDIEDIDLVWTKNGDYSTYIITYGSSVLKYEELTKDDSNVGVINARIIKPVDTKMLDEIKNSKIFVVEEHSSTGNLYTLINEYYVNSKCSVDIEALNLGNNFVEHGDVDSLKKEYNIFEQQVYDYIKEK